MSTVTAIELFLEQPRSLKIRGVTYELIRDFSQQELLQNTCLLILTELGMAMFVATTPQVLTFDDIQEANAQAFPMMVDDWYAYHIVCAEKSLRVMTTENASWYVVETVHGKRPFGTTFLGVSTSKEEGTAAIAISPSVVERAKAHARLVTGVTEHLESMTGLALLHRQWVRFIETMSA
jgi:hypothetical protein